MSNNILNKNDLNRSFGTYVMTRQISQNYETMQSCGWVLSMHDALMKIYDDEDVVSEKNKQYFQFFNCQPWMGALIFGACLAIEETREPNATETSINLRTGLMGPFAGLGDAIIFILPMTILGAIAAYSALEGSIFGWVLAQTFGTILWFVFWKLNYVSYNQGVNFVTNRQSQLNHITEAASVLGLVVVGALIASTVHLNISYQFQIGEVTTVVQDMLDQIMPKLTSVIAVVLIYFGLDIKHMNSSRMVWLVIVISVLLALLGIAS